MFTIDQVRFASRAERSHFVARRFEEYLQGRVLDVGCYEAPLRSIIGPERYVGVDFVGDPDVNIDLQATDRLPFDDGEFDSVLCIEVLEHLDNLHAIFEELVRVSSRHIVVSLPNCWRDARVKIARGRGSIGHYGLPVDRPVDRHRWFFCMTETREFMRARAKMHGLQIVESFGTEPMKHPLVRLVRRAMHPGERYHNRYGQTLWTVFRKDRAGDTPD